MKKTRIYIRRFLLFSLIFLSVFIIYFLLVPIKIYKHRRYEFEKFIDIFNVNSNSKPEGYYFSPKECGFFNLDSGVTFYKRVESDEISILANKFFFIEYNSKRSTMDVYSISGKIVNKIILNGYPYISNDLPIVFVINFNGLGFSIFDMQGNILVDQIKFTSIITSLHADKDYNILISTLEGRAYLFSINKTLIADIKTDGSKIPLIKSNSIEYNGNLFAICSGLYPEYIEIFKKDSGNRVIKFKTDTNFRYETFLKFSGNRIYFEGNEKLNYYDLKYKKFGSIKIKGRLNEIAFSKNERIMISSSKDGIDYLTVYSPNGAVKFYKEFRSNIDSIKFVNNDDFYFKIEDRIIKVRETI